ncbi:hypothetical protein IAR55_003748 [Kwoniella newhampshirensis]|uniref:Sulfatase N-terminal domain-containing protein n=1 Tax=Kwoniella newhampshirensis TaxID=1651941 RepID=A0AAW0YKJ7_9TREE
MTTPKRPNFLLIVADDLGYSDLGCYGSEIRTPNIDRLAAEGLRFSDYHTAPMCSVARAMLMSGTDTHVAMQHVMTQDPSNYNTSGNEGYLTRNIAAMPELLDDAGYLTFMSGKWHLGFRPGYIPSDRGFQKVFSCLPASSNHFGYDPKWDGGEENRAKVHGHQPPIYVKQDQRYVVEPNMTSSSEGFYSSITYVDTLLSYFRDRTERQKEKPFFAYLPFTAPHYPLQCLKSDRDKYLGVYDSGHAVLRLKRLAQLIKLGIIPPDVNPHEVVSPENKHWDELTDKEKKFSSRAMECYAGMVECMDRQVGRVLDYLEETGELDGTVVLFFSDNGAEGTALEAEEVVGPWLIEVINKFYNNEYDNIGNADSFAWMGPRWCQASTAPNRLYKHYTTEGGIRVPLVMRYPGFSHLPKGSICHSFTTAMDVLPTFLDLAGIKHPNTSPSHPRETAKYHDRMVFPMRGKSWTPWERQADTIYGDDNPVVAWEHYGKAALRNGRWKIVSMPKQHPTGTGKWQLYDMYTDQGETRDLAAQFPDKVEEMLVLWEQWLRETGAHYTTPLETNDGFLDRDIIGDQRAWMRLGNGKKFDEAF